jgi:hypothetical protein
MIDAFKGEAAVAYVVLDVLMIISNTITKRLVSLPHFSLARLRAWQFIDGRSIA